VLLPVRLALGAERRLSGLALRRVTVDDHEIHYLERGADRQETLLLIHGFGADKDNWVRFVRALGPLKKTHRIVALDLPGFGDSTRRDEAPYSVPVQVERLHALAEALGLGPLHLVGSSMGGAIAGRYAASYPERVRSLCLIEPLALRGPEPSEMSRLLARGELPLVAENRQEYEALLDFVFEQRPFLPGFLRHHLAGRALARRDHLKRVWKQVWDDLPEPLADCLHSIQARTLLLWGDTDRVFHLSAMVELESRLPRVTSHVFPHCGHLPMVERPRETGERFERWFDTACDV
jgi:pimeloyl-ACP methyl ester carboxylesterase